MYICIVNTCTFIAESTNQSLDSLIELGDKNKKLIVTGCLAQRYKEDLFNEFPQVKAVLGTGDIEEIVTKGDAQLELCASSYRHGIQE